MRRITSRPTVRRILSGFCLCLAGTLGCGQDELSPGGGFEYAVWIAQSVSGTVWHHRTFAPIPGATVTLTAGFELTQLFPFGTTTSTSLGSYSFVRAAETQVPGDFWWLGTKDTKPRTVYVQLEVHRGEYLPAFPRQQLSRTPSKNAPTTSLGAYSLTLNAPMKPVPDE